MEIQENERIDAVNASLSLIQKKDGLTFGTDALLLAAYVAPFYKTGAELGGGSGIISMLLLARGKLARTDCIEVQKEYAELIERNAELNGLSERLSSVFADIRFFTPPEEYELIYTNPPYMKTTSGKKNAEDKKNIARHEVKGDIFDFLSSAKRLLKYGGDFFAVYRPDRLTDLFCAMRENGIEPKRMTLVHADTNAEPSMALVEGRRGGRAGLKLTKPLVIYADSSHKIYTGDMEYVMNEGSFPEKFRKR